MFATTKLAVYDAERSLTNAQNRLQDSQKLFLRGLITDAQLASDRFAVDRAKHEVELAQSEKDGYRIASEIDLMQAEYTLKTAEDQLEYIRRLANHGYSSISEINDRKALVDIAKKKLEAAQQKLAEIQKQ